MRTIEDEVASRDVASISATCEVLKDAYAMRFCKKPTGVLVPVAARRDDGALRRMRTAAPVKRKTNRPHALFATVHSYWI